MAANTEGQAPGAGWFPDPGGSPNLRWWDGSDWSTHLIDPVTGAPPQPQQPAQQPPEPRPVTAGDQPLTRRELREQQAAAEAVQQHSLDPQPVAEQFLADQPVTRQQPVAEPPVAERPLFEELLGQTIEPVSPPTVFPAQAAPFAPAPPGLEHEQTWTVAPPPDIADAYVPDSHAASPFPLDTTATKVNPIVAPMTRTRSREAPVEEMEPRGSSTASVWILAVLPILHLALIWCVYELLKPADGSIIRWVVIAGPIIVYLVLAGIDHRQLRQREYISLAPTALAILPPLYLGIRAVRVGVTGIAPLVVWFLLQAAVVGALMFVFPSVFSQLTATEAVETTTPVSAVSATPHILTADERTQQLTQSGMAAEIKKDFLTQGVTFGSVTCPPLPSTTDGSQVSCRGTLDSMSLDILVAVDSTSPTVAFDILSSLPSSS